MNEKLKSVLMIFLGLIAFISAITLLIFMLSEAQPLSEKLSYGESSRTFCHNKGGEYYDALFSQDQCYLDGHSYEVYYDNTQKQWRFAN